MGLDAAVSCRCWEDGLCNVPAALAPRLWQDPVTGEVNQTIPEHLPEQEDVELYVEHYLWVMQGACAHEHMRIVSERISNWGGLRDFQHALRSAGRERHAALLREIPDGNGGLTTPAAARMCLTELDHFCSMGEFGTVVELVDGASGDVVHIRTEPYDGWLASSGATGITFRLNADATFQVERGAAGVMQRDPDAVVLFRSRAFSQAAVSGAGVRFTDLASGGHFVCPAEPKGSLRLPGASFKVTRRADTPAQYAYCVQPLRRVFQAAVDTGHPVLWC